MEASTKDYLLVARGVYRRFNTNEGPLEVLKGVNLSINEGDMLAIVGESGVGKSTLLHILGGLDRPTKGEVSVKGEKYYQKSESELARFRNRNIGFVFQHHYLMEDFTACENVMMPMLISGKDKKIAARLAEQLLDDVGLLNRKTHHPRQLSGGEQQRVAVARALANNPGLVIADEPSGNLDIKTGEKLHRLLNELNENKNITFLIATHNKDLASTCRKTVRLDEGLITDENSLKSGNK